MISWHKDITIYLHRDSVDFRKAINGLSIIVEEGMELNPFDRSIFVFCNKRRTQVKVLYWDQSGFALWQKRLEKDKFKWPKRWKDEVIHLSHEQWVWLLRGFDINQLTPHEELRFQSIN